jgi:hypothetical protein
MDWGDAFECAVYVIAGLPINSIHSYRWTLRPTSFGVAGMGDGTALDISANESAEYEIELNALTNTYSCGDPAHDGDYLHYSVVENARVSVSADFGLHGSFKHKTDDHGERCTPHVTYFNKTDITDKLLNRLADQYLNRFEDGLRGKLDAYSVALRAGVSEAWDSLRKPIYLGDVPLGDDFPNTAVNLWIQPSALGISGLSASGSNDDLVLNATIGIKAFPVVDTEIWHEPGGPVPTKIDIEPYDPNSGFRIFADIKVPYQALESELDKGLVGQTFKKGWFSSEVSSVYVYGSEDDSHNSVVAIEVNVKGNPHGSIYLTAKPVVDPATNELFLSNAAFTVATEQKVENFLLFKLGSTQVRQAIEKFSHYPLQPRLTDIIDKANGVGSFTFSNPDGSIKFHLSKISVADIYPIEGRFDVRARLEGSAEGAINYTI